MLHTLRISLQNAVYFIMLLFFFFCIIHILHTECLKFKCKTFGAKRLIGILFYCDVISFKETRQYGKTAETWRRAASRVRKGVI
jgi:hypothetical protein